MSGMRMHDDKTGALVSDRAESGPRYCAVRIAERPRPTEVLTGSCCVRLLRPNEVVNALDQPEVWLAAGSKIANEAGIFHGGFPESCSGHLATLEKSVDLGEKLFCLRHDDAQYRTIPINQEEKSYFPKNREFPTNTTMDAVRKLILEKIDERGTTMAEISRKIGRNHAYLQQFIHRNTDQDVPEKIRAALAAELGVDEYDLRPAGLKVPKNGTISVNQPKNERPIAGGGNNRSMSVNEQNAPDITPGALLIGDRDLPVFGTAQGGRGAIVLSSDPVDWVLRPDSLLRVKDGYGVIITGDSMSPEHKSGSTALVNPHIPRRSGDTCIFRNHADDGGVVMCIKELVRETDDLWHVKQHNPKKAFTLKKADWQVCHVTVGNYFRR